MNGAIGFFAVIIVLIIILAILASCIKIVPQAQALVVERLGAYLGTWSVGVHIKMPILDRVAKRVNLKEQVADFPPQPNAPAKSQPYGVAHGKQIVGTWCIGGYKTVD